MMSERSQTFLVTSQNTCSSCFHLLNLCSVLVRSRRLIVSRQVPTTGLCQSLPHAAQYPSAAAPILADAGRNHCKQLWLHPHLSEEVWCKFSFFCFSCAYLLECLASAATTYILSTLVNPGITRCAKHFPSWAPEFPQRHSMYSS